MKINLGSGPLKIDGYKNVDVDESVRPDYVAPCDNLPFANDSLDEIFTSHMVEHLTPWHLHECFIEWHRVLKVGGTLAIETPNLEKIIDWMKSSNDYCSFASHGMAGLFGDALTYNDFMAHKWGYTPESLKNFLENCNFTDIKILRPKTHYPTRDFRIECRKKTVNSGKGGDSKIKVKWILSANENVASSRMQGTLIHKGLINQGVDSEIFLKPNVLLYDSPWEEINAWRIARLCSRSVVVVQKLRGNRTRKLIEWLSRCSCTTIYVACDLLDDGGAANAADLVICPSKNLARNIKVSDPTKVRVVQDPAEVIVSDSEISISDRTKGIKLAWIGHSSNWDSLKELHIALKYESLHDVTIVTCSDHPDADVSWSMERSVELLKNCDICVVPTSSGPFFEAKSANRILLAMGLGCPVIAGRIESYVDVIDHGISGYFAQDASEFETAINELRSPSLRATIAKEALIKVRDNYSSAQTVLAWKSVIEEAEKLRKSIPWLHTDLSKKERKLELDRVELLSKKYIFKRNISCGNFLGLISQLFRSCFICMRSPKLLGILWGIASDGVRDISKRARS